MNSRLENQPSWSWSLAAAFSALFLLGVFATSAATFTVTTNADSGEGSLREAITAATNGDTIIFSLPSPSTITLTSGKLAINQGLTITGPGPASLAIDGSATNAVFDLSGNSVAISGLTITNGQRGVYCEAGSAIISNVVITGNTAGAGGGIYAQNTDLQIINSSVTSNSAVDGGGVYFTGHFFGTNIFSMVNTSVNGNLATNGGGIYLLDGLSHVLAGMSGVVMTGNQATAAGGGIYNAIANLNLKNSVISSNVASGGRGTGSASGGGGIYASHGAMTSANLTMIGNIASDTGGAVYDDGASSALTNATLIGNSAGFGGGAIANEGGGFGPGAATTLFNCVVSSNSASSGGAIYSFGNTYGIGAQVFNSTFSCNRATNEGGAISSSISGSSGIVEVVGSTFNGNVAATGGAIYSSGGPGSGYPGNALVGITNSTFSGNAAVTGGAIYNSCAAAPPPPGGTANANVQIFNSTFTGNTATNGGLLFNTNSGTGTAPVLIGSSILNAGAFGGTIMNSGGTIGSAGYNLSSDNAGGALTNGTDLTNTDPMLGPLQNNGGAVLTHALLPGSPAINTGYNFSGFANDERGAGFARNYGPTDIGAFELQLNISAFANWQLRNFGCTNCPQADPGADPDGDGASNMAEFLAGTNPNSTASVFRITGVKRQGNDLLVTWQTVGGRTNVVQASTRLASGSFSDISSNIVIPGTGDTTASYLESGAAINGTSSYHRVRLGP